MESNIQSQPEIILPNRLKYEDCESSHTICARKRKNSQHDFGHDFEFVHDVEFCAEMQKKFRGEFVQDTIVQCLPCSGRWASVILSRKRGECRHLPWEQRGANFSSPVCLKKWNITGAKTWANKRLRNVGRYDFTKRVWENEPTYWKIFNGLKIWTPKFFIDSKWNVE